jgi:methyl-accepting chemotaxis protein
MADLLRAPDGGALDAAALDAGRPVTGRMQLSPGTLLDGSLTPIRGSDGAVTGFVLIATDVTAAQAAIDAAEARRLEMEAEQTRVVDRLRQGLETLSNGDLRSRITEVFPENYESVRNDFNTTVERLHDAIASVRSHAGTIASEAGSISGAAEDLSRRTETQAATLEQTAATIAQITELVRETAEGARRAKKVVGDARGTAESSGGVIHEAVVAMGEIEGSSEQISRIVAVIDDITFQTNLLALNAGVEAARAGEAGRGFAVVAAEVRALAQRSSEAAREIGTLITASSGHVTRGVGLVRRAGEALDTIFKSISGIADPVAAIATSAEDQATSLQDINAAMQQLDQVTQQNAAMFEETSAASVALTRETEAMNDEMRRFRTGPRVLEDGSPGAEEDDGYAVPRLRAV